MTKKAVSKEEMVRRLEKAYACEDYFPGVLGSPVTFAARWGLPLSRSYRKFKEHELRAARRRRKPAAKSNGAAKMRRRTVKR